MDSESSTKQSAPYFGAPNLERKVNGCRKSQDLRELTIGSRLTRANRPVQLLFYALEELSTPLQMRRSPKPLINIGRAQNLRSRLFEPVLVVPNLSLQFHRPTQLVCVVNRVRLGAIDVSLCVVEPAFVEKQPSQGMVDPKQAILPAERGCDSEGYLVMVNGLPRLALGLIYIAKRVMRLAEQKLMICLREEINCAGCGFFGGVELLV